MRGMAVRRHALMSVCRREELREDLKSREVGPEVCFLLGDVPGASAVLAQGRHNEGLH